MKHFKENLATIGWSVKLAFKLNPWIFISIGSISFILSILPALALKYNKYTVSIISDFLLTGNGTFENVVIPIVSLGILLTIIGLSKRINSDFLYFVMYDAYYFGLEEYVMSVIQHIELKTLMDSKYRDNHSLVMGRCGSLTDFMSSGCLFLSKIIGAISLLVVSCQISWMIFFMSTAYIILIIVVNILVADKLQYNLPVYKEANRLSEYYQKSVMVPGVAKELRIYHLIDETIDKWRTAYKGIEDADKKYAKLSQKIVFWGEIAFIILLIAMLGYCIYFISIGNMSVDIFLMLYILGQNINELTKIISKSLQEINRGLVFLKLQRNFINSIPKDEVNHVKTSFDETGDIVFQVENMCFSYDDEKEVLHNLSFSIKKGETIALIGINGSGKTTLVKLLIGLFAPTSGSLQFYGQPYNKQTKSAIIEKTGMFFQDFYIFHASLRENIGFGDVNFIDDTERIRNAMIKGGAEKIPLHLKNGLDHWLERNVKKDGAILSGGEKQRVAVSRAHMNDKDILIFDEPAAALDPIAEMNQFKSIQEKIEGRTAILISHRVAFARLADRIFVLDHGHLKEIGTHDELMKKNGVYTKLFQEQAQWYETESGE